MKVSLYFKKITLRRESYWREKLRKAGGQKVKKFG